MSPVFHCWRYCLFLRKCVNAIEKTHATGVALFGTKRFGGLLQRPSKHDASGCEIAALQVVFCLSIGLRDTLGDVLGRVNLPWLRMHCLNPKFPSLQIVGASYQELKRNLINMREFDNNTLPAAPTSEESAPSFVFGARFRPQKRLYVRVRTTKVEIHLLRTAIRTV